MLVTVGFRADDDGGDFGVGPNCADVSGVVGVQFFGALFGARRIVVPDGFYVDVGMVLELLDEARCVNVGTADEGHGYHVASG